MIHSGDHEFVSGTATDPCIHCNVPYEKAVHGGAEITCVPHRKSTDVVMPEPARRVYAVEDFDTIGARAAEIRKEEDVHLQGQ